ETVPKLLDFGMAKLLSESAVQTVSGVPIGTPLYMSPEQARGEKVDGRSDVYALGVLCHEMLTGKVPFTGESPLAVLVSHLTLPAPRASEVFPELPTELDEPILSMLQKEPAGRPATAGAAIAGLVAAAERAGISVPAGMPHLPRPRELPAATPSTFSPRRATPASDSSDSEARAALVGADTQPSSQQGATSWPMLIGLVAVAMLVAYLGRSALEAPSNKDSAATEPAPAATRPASSTPGPSLDPSRAPPSPPPSALPPAPAAAPAAPTAPAAGGGAPAPAAPSAEQHPEHVQLTLRGAPAGARVQRGDDVLGEASKPVRLPFGTAPLELTVTAPGHEPQTLSVVPDHDAASDVKLRRRAARPKPTSDIPKDLESPF
ncbi:MAG TPA: protein kinase, partial [Polyangiaceae bacterium]|nr:protein kinase [Polyangiaceae bacterium]